MEPDAADSPGPDAAASCWGLIGRCASRVRRVGWLLALFVGAQAVAAEPQYSREQLDQLTAQVALYPDALLSQVLMASTYPSDVTAAAEWARAHPDAKGDEAVKQVESLGWDPSVASLVAFPQVIVTMGEKSDWVRDLGDAFLAQPEDVMESVQRLRAQAQKAGNLNSNEQTVVRVENEPPDEPATRTVERQVIYIEPAQPQVVFVPTYNPLVVYGPWMYPAFPPVYIPPPPGYWWSVAVGGAIATGIAWGVSYAVRDALWGGCNWWRRDVNININHYNNININRRIDVNTTRARWSHDPVRRGAVPYRGGEATRQQLTRRAESVKRDNYRGRAEAAMRDGGLKVDRAASRDPGGRDRPQVGANGRQPVARPGNVADKRPTVPATREKARDQVAARDRTQAKAELKKTNRDYPLKDAGSPRTRPQIDRGMQSRQSMEQLRRPQVQKPTPRPQARPQAQPRPQARPQPRPAPRPQAQPRAKSGAR